MIQAEHILPGLLDDYFRNIYSLFSYGLVFRLDSAEKIGPKHMWFLIDFIFIQQFFQTMIITGSFLSLENVAGPTDKQGAVYIKKDAFDLIC